MEHFSGISRPAIKEETEKVSGKTPDEKEKGAIADSEKSVEKTSNEQKKSYEAVSKDGDTLELTKTKNEGDADKTVITEEGRNTSAVKYSAATLAKLSRSKLQHLLTSGQITRAQYQNATRKK